MSAPTLRDLLLHLGKRFVRLEPALRRKSGLYRITYLEDGERREQEGPLDEVVTLVASKTGLGGNL